MEKNKFTDLLENQKSIVKDIFKHEDLLLSELDRYEQMITSFGRARSSLEIAMVTIYKAHVKNIKHLLDNLHIYKKLRTRTD